MKKLLLLVSVLYSLFASGQVPAQINYQGIARNSVGNVLPNQKISVRLSIRSATTTGPVVYTETRALTTSNLGLFNIAIGSGGATDVAGNLSSVDWGTGAKFLQVEIDPQGGSQFLVLGTSQLLAVPYALYANSAAKALPFGDAGGDLTGIYPNPSVADNAITSRKISDGAITTGKIMDSSVTLVKLAKGIVPDSLPPTGQAGGELTGIYPNPSIGAGVISTSKMADGAVTTSKLADNSVTTSKVVDGSITMAKLGPDVILNSGNPTGPAGGALTGNYPNPDIASNAITTIKLSDNSVTTPKIVDASVTAVKLAPGVLPTTLPPSGNAGGDLTGLYPNPTIANAVITSAKLADNSVTTSKIVDASVTAVKLAPGVLPATLPPSGNAGGDLTGLYPNPTIANAVITSIKLADNSVTTPKIVDASVTAVKLAPGVIPTTLPPTGNAGGDLTGIYPNPSIANSAVTNLKLADNAVTTTKLADTSVTTAKIANNSITTVKIVDASVTNPKLADGAVTTSKIVDNAIVTSKILDGSVTMAKLGPDVVLGSGGSPTGPAGGDLNGTYPNPNIAAGAVTIPKLANGSVITPKIADGAVTTNKIADLAVTTAKVADGSITMAKLGPDVILGSGGSPTGPAGGDLTGNYPNPLIGNLVVTTGKIADASVTTAKLSDLSVSTQKLIDNSVTTTKIADGSITTAKLSDLSVSTQKLIDNAVTTTKMTDAAVTTSKIADGAVTTPKLVDASVTDVKLADNSVTTSKIVDASVTAIKLAPGVIPTTLPPSGNAGGDLSGIYPNPAVAKLQGTGVSATLPSSGQVLKFNGTQWAPGTDNGGGIILPYAATDNNAASLFSISNQGSGSALEGINSSTAANTIGVTGKISSASAGVSSTALRGIHNGTGVNGYGVWGSHNGYGIGVYGNSINGNGVQGSSTNGNGLFGTSTNGSAGYFDISNAANSSDALMIYTVGFGTGATAISEQGNGLWGITYSGSSAGVLGYNSGGGEGVVGRTVSATAAGVVGKNEGTYAGVEGVGYADNGVGVHAIVNQDGFLNGNALVAEVDGAGNGNPAVFKANGANVARIDKTGKGFFNGGTQVGGADVAEMFNVEGDKNSYEPGDVLVISTNSDRTVEKSNSAYSTLVAGVYATKPGLMLTQENAEADQLQNLVPMGVVGVIPVKVCLEGGPIKRGDLLVTSSLAGIAMKADLDKIKPGQLIGKALQDYNGDNVAKINVLVNVK